MDLELVRCPRGSTVAHSRPVRTPQLLIAVACLLFVACGSTSVESPSPTLQRCGVSATLSQSSFSAAGGSGALTVTTARECDWNLASDAAWLIPELTTGQGEATVPFTVRANTTPTIRRAALAVGSTRVEVAQEGVPCTFELDTTRLEVDAALQPGQQVELVRQP